MTAAVQVTSVLRTAVRASFGTAGRRLMPRPVRKRRSGKAR